jgi:tRNA nucleotidyltransferase (CCA-adding enzyme)
MNKVYEALHPSILNVMRRLESQGFETFVVGGFLRDLFLSRETSDIDLATAARPEEVDRVLCDLTVIPTGIQHGTVTVLVGDRSIEVTTFRKDGAYADHRHPTTVT